MRTYIFFFASLFLSTISFSQKVENRLIGTWKIVYSYDKSDSALVWNLEKIDTPKNAPPFMYGSFVEFHRNGTYIQRASAPCGLDDDRYGFIGTWMLNSDNEILLTINVKNSAKRPNIYDRYELLATGKMKMISIQKKSIQLKITQPWEKKYTKEK